MAIGNLYGDPSDYIRRQYEYEKRMAYEQMRGLQNMQNNQLARAIGADYAVAEQKQAPKPVPQPEPNKVLLLLGEDA